jgi:adenylyltransferase/sulfurtransferase
MLDRGEKFFFVDCRLPHERQITRIDGTELIPLQEIQKHGDKLQPHKDETVIVHCKVGGRSMQFVKILRDSGFTKARSMAGGIILWNKDFNPGEPQY